MSPHSLNSQSTALPQPLPSNYAKHITRPRSGSRHDAKFRLKTIANFLDLVSPPVSLAPTLLQVNTIARPFWRPRPLGRFLSKDRTIEISNKLGPYDAAFTYAHELGHLFDNDYLDDELRLYFARCVGITSDIWEDYRVGHCLRASEAFAATFALLSLSSPWRCSKHHEVTKWVSDDLGAALFVAERVITEALRRSTISTYAAAT